MVVQKLKPMQADRPTDRQTDPTKIMTYTDGNNGVFP